MNYMRKQAALKKYQSAYDEKTATIDEIKDLLTADPLNFTEEERAEILEEIMADKTEKPKSEQPLSESAGPLPPDISAGLKQNESAESDAKPQPRAGVLQTYSKYKVKPKYSTMVIRGKKEEVLQHYEKTGDCLQVTNIEPKHAEILNQQLPNTMTYYFAEGEPDLLPAENFF